MANLLKRLHLVGLAFWGTSVLAGGLPFQNLGVNDYKNVVEEFSANFVFAPVSGAKGLGSPFGVEFGAMTGRTQSPMIDRYVKEVNPNISNDNLPHISLLGALTIPLGLTFEAGYLPTMGTSYFKFNTMAAAVKWTPTDFFENSPVHLAARAHIQRSALEYSYYITPDAKTDFEYESVVSGATALLSFEIAPMVEPYVGFGVVTGQGKLKATGNDTVFSDPTFKENGEAKATVASPIWMAGVELKMGILRFGFEYSQQFGVDTYNGKFTFVPF
ncbi:MAG: DUF6588 family protein [Bdellovibrionales bacterium]